MVTIAVKQKVSRAHVAPQAVCNNLINALELFANQQTGGDSLVEMLVVGLQERGSLKMLRRFMTVDIQGGDDRCEANSPAGRMLHHKEFATT